MVGVLCCYFFSSYGAAEKTYQVFVDGLLGRRLMSSCFGFVIIVRNVCVVFVLGVKKVVRTVYCCTGLSSNEVFVPPPPFLFCFEVYVFFVLSVKLSNNSCSSQTIILVRPHFVILLFWCVLPFRTIVRCRRPTYKGVSSNLHKSPVPYCLESRPVFSQVTYTTSKLPTLPSLSSARLFAVRVK